METFSSDKEGVTRLRGGLENIVDRRCDIKHDERNIGFSKVAHDNGSEPLLGRKGSCKEKMGVEK